MSLAPSPVTSAVTAALCLSSFAPSHALAEPPRGVAQLGVASPAQAMMHETLYGVGPTIGAGAELGEGPSRVLAAVRWTGLSTTGARDDLVSLGAAWRGVPGWAGGAFASLGGGVGVDVERVRLVLPGRDVEGSSTRVGAPLSLSLGWLSRRFEAELGATLWVLPRGEPTTRALLHASLGGRL